MMRRLIQLLARLLDASECEAVLGDLAESNRTGARALRDVIGLVARRQAALWKQPWAWVALALAVPIGWWLSIATERIVNPSATYIWMYANNWDWAFLRDPAFRYDFPAFSAVGVIFFLRLVCWSWTGGFAIGSLSRGTHIVNAILVCGILLVDELQHLHTLAHPPFMRHEADFDTINPVFTNRFYHYIFPVLMRAILVWLPLLRGVRLGSKLADARSPVLPVLRIAALVAFAIVAIQRWRGRPPVLDSWIITSIFYWPVVYWISSAIQRRRMKESSI
jgi:hypothetical protein